ncbi:hypothetical protein, partial [Streptomyces mirabilis]|uniref:hypothetical protein n=1 Tax=Streptomyces mirabilis TaxID=68239 RepID=UPI003404F6EE
NAVAFGGYCHLWFTVMTADGRRWLAGSSGALLLNGVIDDFSLRGQSRERRRGRRDQRISARPSRRS